MSTDSTTKILVADDDLEILALVARHLSGLPAEVIEASDGEEALRLARREKPTLVVLDVMMPGMSGWEVCRAIREDESLGSTGVIMLTGIGERLNEMTSPSTAPMASSTSLSSSTTWPTRFAKSSRAVIRAELWPDCRLRGICYPADDGLETRRHHLVLARGSGLLEEFRRAGCRRVAEARADRSAGQRGPGQDR